MFWEFLVQKVRESLALIAKLLNSEIDLFKRADYKFVAILVRVYQTGDTDSFNFSKPIKTRHVRFLQ